MFFVRVLLAVINVAPTKSWDFGARNILKPAILCAFVEVTHILRSGCEYVHGWLRRECGGCETEAVWRDLFTEDDSHEFSFGVPVNVPTNRMILFTLFPLQQSVEINSSFHDNCTLQSEQIMRGFMN